MVKIDLTKCIEKFNHNDLKLYNEFEKTAYYIDSNKEYDKMDKIDKIDDITYSTTVCLLNLNIIIIGGAINDITRIQYPETNDIQDIIDFYKYKGFNINLEIYDVNDFVSVNPDKKDKENKYKELNEYENNGKKIYNFKKRDFGIDDYKQYDKDYNLVFTYANIHEDILPTINNTTFIFHIVPSKTITNYFKFIKYVLDDETINYYNIYIKKIHIVELDKNCKLYLSHVLDRYLQLLDTYTTPDVDNEDDKNAFEHHIEIINDMYNPKDLINMLAIPEPAKEHTIYKYLSVMSILYNFLGSPKKIYDKFFQKQNSHFNNNFNIKEDYIDGNRNDQINLSNLSISFFATAASAAAFVAAFTACVAFSISILVSYNLLNLS